MFETLLSKVKVLLKNPMIVFVYGVLSKWYITIFLTAIVVVYWVFKGLTEAGVMQASEEVIFKAFRETKSVARYCVPKIMDLKSFWECLQSPPNYEETQEEKSLKKGLENLTYIGKYDPKEDPYAPPAE